MNLRKFNSLKSLLGVAITCLVTTVSLNMPASANGFKNYIVLYKGTQSVPADAARLIAKSGGKLIYSYNQIGVVIARSDSASFLDAILQDSRVQNASATDGFAVKLNDDAMTAGDANGAPADQLPNTPVSDSDSLSGLQWDMVQIHAPEAHAITGGSPSVVVGDIDTGLDFTHPDIANNYDAANSVDCTSGAPSPLLPGNDVIGHGTHTAGTIAAAANGVGIVGVAPNVKIAGIKSGVPDPSNQFSGLFFPEAVICAFVWAGDHHLDVTNNSYFVDPWRLNCRNDPEQRAIWEAERRAIRYAQSRGVTVIASMGNEFDDLAHPTIDDSSPDFPPDTAITREVTNACATVPVEIPGVIGVSADGNLRQKALYSNYGVGVTQVVAPGGDSVFQVTSDAPNGRVLSTWPAALPPASCARRVVDPSGATYCYLQGTSMAAPHVTGVAALIISQFGKMSPGRVQAYINQTADPIPCPPNPFLFPDWPRPSGDPQTCQGGIDYNAFYGHGEVNALEAILHGSGQ